MSTRITSQRHPQLRIDRYPWSTRNQHSTNIFINTQSTSHSILSRHQINTWSTSLLTLDQQSANSPLSVDRLICINQKLVASQMTVDRNVNRVPADVSMECWLSIDRVMIKDQLRVDCQPYPPLGGKELSEGRLRVLINTRPRMTLVGMIHIT